MTDERSMPVTSEHVAVIAQALREWGDCLRGDWSEFDGRSAKYALNNFADELEGKRQPHDIAFHRMDLGMCPDGNGHWGGKWGHCDVSTCPTFAAQQVSA